MAKRISDENAMHIAGKAIVAELAMVWEDLEESEVLDDQLQLVSNLAKGLGYKDPLTAQDFQEVGVWMNLATIHIEVKFQ